MKSFVWKCDNDVWLRRGKMLRVGLVSLGCGQIFFEAIWVWLKSNFHRFSLTTDIEHELSYSTRDFKSWTNFYTNDYPLIWSLLPIIYFANNLNNSSSWEVSESTVRTFNHLSSNLVAALANLNMNNFTHFPLINFKLFRTKSFHCLDLLSSKLNWTHLRLSSDFYSHRMLNQADENSRQFTLSRQ